MRRVAAVAVVAWGLLLIVVGALGLPKAHAAQRLINGARPLVARDYLAQEQALIVEGRKAAAELFETGVPRLGDALHVPADQVQQSIAQSYPDVANGQTKLASIFDTTAASLANLQRHHTDFHDADTFPAPHVSRVAECVATIVFGSLLVVLGALVWLRPLRWAVAVALVLTLVSAVAPLVVGLPGRAHGVERMAASLNLSQSVASRTRASFETVVRMVDQLERELIPDAAAAAGMTPEQLTAQLEAGLPDLQAAVAHYETVVRLFTPDVLLREKAVHDFAAVKDVPVVALTWTFIACNAAIALIAGLALSGMRPPVSGPVA